MKQYLSVLKETLICGGLLIVGFLIPNTTIQNSVFALAIAIGGYHQTVEGVTDTIKNKRLNVELLMILSAIGASLIGNFAEGAILIFIFSLSGSLEDLTLDKSQREIRSLMELQPTDATKVLEDGSMETVAIDDLNVGDLILVRVGETVALDGVIIQGSTSIEEASITGEPIPASKEIGDNVYGGTLNVSHPITIEVTHKADDILIQKIIRMVEEAESHSSNTSQFIDKIEDYYARIVLIVVALVIIIPWIIFKENFNDAFYRGMVLLVVASPCALIASVTPATLSAISNGAKKGILVKGGLYFENLMDTKAIAFDKTGTLTQGQPKLTDFYLKDGNNDSIAIIVGLEEHSSHPLAKAVVDGLRSQYNEHASRKITLSNIEEKAGFGVEGTVDGVHYKVGKLEYMTTQDSIINQEAAIMVQRGDTLVYIQKDDEIIGVMGLVDIIREDAKELISWLNSQKIETIMITGDTEETAQIIANQLGITRIIARCLPEQKAEIVQDLKKEYTHVMMVGDGINDAPALANASIGVAMSSGTDIAIETADIILVKDSLLNLQYAIELSRKLRTIIKQNIIFAMAVIFVLVTANFMNIVNLPLGVVGHEGSTILVILNSIRLLKPLNIKEDSI